MNKEQFIALGLTDEQATKAAAASGEELKTYIPKHRFDEVNEENKTLKTTVKENATQLETLKTSAGDNAELKKQIETLQEENKKKDEDHQAELKDIKLTNAIKLAVADKAHDADMVAGLFDKTKLIIGDDGKVTGLDEQLKTLSESKSFLFKPADPKPADPKPGFKIGGDGNPNPPAGGQTPSIKEALTALYQTK